LREVVVSEEAAGRARGDVDVEGIEGEVSGIWFEEGDVVAVFAGVADEVAIERTA
jgi:hypothetical protein